MNITKNIRVEELVPRATYEQLGAAACSKLVNRKLAEAAQLVRNHFDRPLTINTWYVGGELQYRGWRPKDCSIGATNSQHKLGMALDFSINGIPAETIRDYIRKNWAELFKPLGITRLERSVSWVHMDMKPTGKDVLVEFNP